MGGNVPLGYEVKDRKLVVQRGRGRDRAHDLRAVRPRSARRRCWRGSCGPRASRTKRGKPIDKGYLYKLLNNRTYIGEAVHKGTAYPGEHAGDHRPGAVGQGARHPRSESPRTRAANTRAQTPALLKGLIFGPTGAAMSPTHTRKGNRLYRYYVSQDVLKRGPDACPVGRVPAAEIEAAVIDQLRGIFRQPEIIVGTWRAARAEQDDVTEDEVREALLQLDPLWDELFPAEQARIVQLLVERVDLAPDGMRVRLAGRGSADAGRASCGRGRHGRHETKPESDRQGLGARRLDDHRPHPDDLEASRWPQGDHRAGRRRCLGAAEATARQHADSGAGAGASVEADVGGGEVPIGGRARGSRGRNSELRQPAAAAHAVGAGHRRGDSGGETAEGDAAGGRDAGDAQRMGSAARKHQNALTGSI